ncbi:unnamed protein product [Polarella glacialis]|uniref:Fibronectin type-III domain-containing protein n=1 Tax=Polarella glacialis TaxID=89957 RepID=A0A813E8J6_POLGL|nr:unnamed protein product [Polarella glacialis]
MLRGSLQDLLPGQSYCIRARAASPAGASDWTDYGQMAQMPPDVPHDPDAILSDIASLEFIEIKWMPPYNNGALILKYEIRMALDEYAPDQLWTMIDENDLAKSTRGHSSSGRRTLARDEGTLVYRQKGLKDGTAYYFKFRAWNIVGCSGWSEVSRFITKSSKPCKLTDVWVKSKTSREITVEWRAPETQGVPLLRYDLVGGPNPRIVKWCQMAAMLMDATADMDRLFGYKKAEDTEFGEPKGSEDFDKLYCEESMYAPILGTQNELTLKNLIPGQDYFFIARGVASTGKGEFSEVLGPITTESEEPKTSEPMTAYHWDEESCSFWFRYCSALQGRQR